MRSITGIILVFLCLFIIPSESEANEGNQLIIINKRTNQLAFFENGNLVRQFKVATGRSTDLTPEGTFQIVNKIKNRPYYKEGIPGGDPKNPLGDRWLGLNARGTYGTTYAIHGNANPASIGTYASSGCVRMYDEEVRWLFDQVNLYTTVYITNSSKSFESIAISKEYMTYSKLKSVTTNADGPQPKNTTISVSANKEGSVESLYKFLIHDGTEWKTIQDFSHSKSLKWNPTKEGTYRIKAQIKSMVSDKEYDDEKELSFDIYIPAELTLISLNEEGPYSTNEEISISTETNQSKNEIQYSVFDGEKWSVIQEYSDAATFTWKPTKPGDYKVRVQARHKLSHQKADEEKELSLTVFEPATLTSVSTDKESPQKVNSPITIIGVSEDDTKTLFKVSVFDGDTWTLLQDYQQNPFVSWQPSKSGEYSVKVQARHEQSKRDFDSEMVIDYSIFEPANLTNLKLTSKGIQKNNHPLRLQASADITTGVEFRFSLYNGSQWRELQDYSNTNILNWTPTQSGFYKIKIETRHIHSGQQYDDTTEVPILVYNSTLYSMPAVLTPKPRIKMKDVLKIKGLPRRSRRKKNW
ncbi:L,D-transpeptidase family protein [Bacillus sp. BGMRC 2118]|nr:L,D-transpeptidase family protein [Bacillus sp. BGMRC 2118]